MIDVWNDDGSLDMLFKNNSLGGGKNWEINDGCLMLSTPLMQFSSQPNGLPNNFVLGLKLINPGSVKITFSV